jgi:hypothetical protein
MRFACLINNTTNTHSEYVLVIAFPQQQWSRERTSMLQYTYIASPVTHLICLIQPSVYCGVRPKVRAASQCYVYSTLFYIVETTNVFVL